MKSTFKTLFYIKGKQLRKNGLAAIMVRITIDGKIAQFSSKIEIEPELWDAKLGRAIGKGANISKINRLLDNIRGMISVHYTSLMSSNGYALPERIKNTFLGLEDTSHTLISFFNQFNEQYKQKIGISGSHTTFTRYELTKQRVIDFMKHRHRVSDMPMKEITTIFVEDFYLYIRNQTTCNNNSAMKFMQRLRAVIQYAKNSGLNFVDPFANFKVSFERVDRAYLEQNEIDTIYKKKFSNKRLEQVRDMFIFSCYTGLSYIDLCNLTAEDIRVAFDGHTWITKKRGKTGVSFNVRLLDIPKDILDKYKGYNKNDKLLPVISNQKIRYSGACPPTISMVIR